MPAQDAIADSPQAVGETDEPSAQSRTTKFTGGDLSLIAEAPSETGSPPLSTASASAPTKASERISNQNLQNGNAENGSGNNSASNGSWLTKVAAFLGWRTEASLRESLEDSLTREDGELDEVFDPSERMLLRNILLLREQRVEDVMVPRADIDAIEIGSDLAEVLEAFRISGHSRMPVYRDTLDNPLGMIHIKDLMAHIARSTATHVHEDEADDISFEMTTFDFSITLEKAGIRRDILFVPPSMPIMDVMSKMQATRTQMALVIDEYGGTDGLVSLEDIVETVVGDIEDEHDEDDPVQIINVSAGCWLADGRIPLEDVAETIGETFQIGEHAEDVDTLGGLLFTLAGRVPVRGEMITSQDVAGFEFEVVEADPRRIKRLRIRRRGQVETAALRPAAKRTDDGSTDETPVGETD